MKLYSILLISVIIIFLTHHATLPCFATLNINHRGSQDVRTDTYQVSLPTTDILIDPVNNIDIASSKGQDDGVKPTKHNSILSPVANSGILDTDIDDQFADQLKQFDKSYNTMIYVLSGAMVIFVCGMLLAIYTIIKSDMFKEDGDKEGEKDATDDIKKLIVTKKSSADDKTIKPKTTTTTTTTRPKND